MSLIAPKLDDRHFQDIVDEAKRRIPHYCGEWTDHNVSDPGVTFIELFAWMTDMILYRMNQVPDRLYIKFMEMMGVQLRGPVAAQVPVTFWLSAPQSMTVEIPEGTEVSSIQTESESPIIFSTNESFQIVVPELTAVFSQIATDRIGEKENKEHSLRLLEQERAQVDVFTRVPQVDDALYLGFENDLSHHVISLLLGCERAGGAGVIPSNPPYVWEVLTDAIEQSWETCEVDLDSSLGMNVSGIVELHLPKMERYRIEDKNLFWIRVRVRSIGRRERNLGILPYEVTPRLTSLAVDSIGGTTDAIHAQVVQNEMLGYCTSEPGQRFFLRRTPILTRNREEEYLVFEVNGGLEPWQEVDDFTESGAQDRHYTIDSMTGEVRLGGALRQPDGSVRQYGAIPPHGARLIFTQYRTGGGLEGNVEVGILNTLKSSIPYFDRVINRLPTKNGLDAENIEQAKMRAPMLIRSQQRAVTAEDFEFLANEALPELIARVRCLQPRPSETTPSVYPGQVYVLVVPRVNYPAGYLSPQDLTMSEEDLKRLTEYLDHRRLLTTRLYARTPAYRWVSVKVTAGAAPGADRHKLELAIMERLYEFLNPLVGGMDGKGWPFGRDLFAADVYQALQGIPNVLFLRNVQLFAATPSGERVGEPLEKLDLVAHSVVASGVHEVELVAG